jgi:oligoribonuclease
MPTRSCAGRAPRARRGAHLWNEKEARVAECKLLVWMDMEMTGLDPERERIIEIATLITDHELAIVAEGPELVIHQPHEVLAAMDEWNASHHGASGLLDRVRDSKITDADAEEQTLQFVATHCPQQTAPLAGSSIHHDRRFLQRYMPRLSAYIHYRNVDVSTVKELVRRWYPTAFQAAPPKRSTHRALDDIRESIAELRYYRDTVFIRPETAVD